MVNIPWRLMLMGGAALTASSFTLWLENKKELHSREPLSVLTRMHNEVRPWDFFWDAPRSADQFPINPEERTLGDARTQSVQRKKFIFIRHGQYNVKAPSSDEKVLTDLGWHQAYETGCYLRRLGIRIDRIIHSNLIRARQTTAALLIGLSDASDDTLFDVPTLVNLSAPYQSDLQGNYSKSVHPVKFSDLGSPNSKVMEPQLSINLKSANQLSCFVAEPYQPYPGASFDCQESHYMAEGPPPIAPEPPGGKSMADEIRKTEGSRLDEGFRVHINRKAVRNHTCNSHSCDCLTETIVFVGHANVFRYWLCRVLQLPPEAWLRIQLYHGSVSCVELCFEPDPGGACVVTATRIGEVGHMPKQLLSR